MSGFQQAIIDSAGVAAALKEATAKGYFPKTDAAECSADDEANFELGDLVKKPLAVMYDLDAWDGIQENLAKSFGPGILHALAIKGSATSSLVKRTVARGFGIECASIGEVFVAESGGCPMDRIVFDSPCKTRAEIAYALKHGMHLNVDNLEELARLRQIRKRIEKDIPKGSVVGIRVNPLCGAGQIAALSVSTAESKFGVPISRKDELLAAFKANPYVNCLHCHCGSGKMGTGTLVEGLRTARDFALEVNKHVGFRQVTVLDIGGGLGPDYTSDAPPAYKNYADTLRKEVPGILRNEDGSGEVFFDKVVTEFGQSMTAKAGFLASRLEYVKPVAIENGRAQIAVGHFGADMCLRQCYTTQNKRRVEFFDKDSCGILKKARTDKGEEADTSLLTHLAGPLCFQGDFPARDLQAPPLEVGDFAVLREGGSNTLALFSRHCSRMTPAVLGYKLDRNGAEPTCTHLEVLTEPEKVDSLCKFWGAEVPPDMAKRISDACP